MRERLFPFLETSAQKNKKNQGAACLTKTSCSSPIAEIIVLQLLTSQEHSYTSLGNREIKMDKLTAQVVCL